MKGQPKPVFSVVGKPSLLPAPPDGAMYVHVDVGREGINIMPVIGMGSLTWCERKACAEGPVGVVFFGSPPLVWIVVKTPLVIFDGSFAPGLNGPAWFEQVVDAVSHAPREFIPTFVDGHNVVERHVQMNVPARTWEKFGRAIAGCPRVHDAAAYEAAIARDEARWTPIAMWNYAISRNRMQEHR